MKNILNVSVLTKSILKAFSRFSLSFVIVFYLTFWILIFNQMGSSYTINYIIFFINIFFLWISINLTLENNDYFGLNKKLIRLISILFFIFLPNLIFINFYYGSASTDSFKFVLLYLIWTISYWFFAPYLKSIFTGKIEEKVYYTYFYRILVIFLLSSIFWWVLFVFWAVFIITVSSLFEVWLDFEKAVFYWATLSFVLFTPIFALTQIPSKEDYRSNYFNENIFFSFLVRFIVVPFICIYFVILYSYTFKVLLTFGDWPKWEVSWMVIGFSILGYISYMISYIFEGKSGFIRVFRKYFPYAVLPQVFMLFYAIDVRIGQYGLTVNRYLVVVFGILLFALSIYYILSKQKHIIFIPSTLTLFIIIISIWPWSVHSLPKVIQFNRLKENLIKAKILVDGKIVPLEKYSDIDIELWKSIYSGIDYLCDFDNCEKIKELFSGLNINFSGYIQDIIEQVTDEIKVKSYYSGTESINQTIRFYSEESSNIDTIFPIDIKGYSEIYIINNWVDFDIENEQVYYAPNKSELKIVNPINHNRSEVIKEIDMSNIIKKLEKLNPDNVEEKKVSPENLIFEIDWYKIVFKNFIIKNPDYEWDITRYYGKSEWYLLVK